MRGINSFFSRLVRRRLLLVAVLSGVLSASLWSLWAADLGQPRASDRQVTLIVSALMRRQHLSKRPLDDVISKRALKMYLKRLDSGKVYFTQADIDEFMQNVLEVDDMIKRGDISLAYTIFNRFLKRMDERIVLIDQLLTEKHDFTIDEELITDRELLNYAKNDQEVREIWRKRIKFNLLVLKGDKTEEKEKKDKDDKEGTKKLSKRYHSVAKRYHQLDNDDILELYLSAVTTSFDPHTNYMSPSSLENFRITMRLELEGIGAQLSNIDGETIVTKIIPGGAADKQGMLKDQDHIVSVGQGEDGEMIDIIDMNLNDVVHRIRGRAGTIVRLGVIPEGGKETKTFSITRAKIELKDSEARYVIIESGKKNNGNPMKIGVINLPSFYMDMEGARKDQKNFKSTTRDVRKILERFNAEGVDSVVLDLRRNGGGSLTESINLTGLFIKTGPVVQFK